MAKAKRKSPRHSARQSRGRSRPKAGRRKAVTVAALKGALEGRDAAALAGMYPDDAVMLVIDRDNPPSSPRRPGGKAEIASYFGDVCGRDMTHMIEKGVASGNQLAFTQSCTYPDGTKVFCSAMLDRKGGKIRQQTVVQAWDG